MSKNKKRLEGISETRKLSQNSRRKLDSVVGNLYTFKYASKTANDPFPLILSVYRTGGGRLFKAKNGRTYTAGITLNNITPGARKLIIEKLMDKKRITYSMIKRAGKIFKAEYRVYDFQKVHNLSLLDSSKYLETL